MCKIPRDSWGLKAQGTSAYTKLCFICLSPWFSISPRKLAFYFGFLNLLLPASADWTIPQGLKNRIFQSWLRVSNIVAASVQRGSSERYRSTYWSAKSASRRLAVSKGSADRRTFPVAMYSVWNASQLCPTLSWGSWSALSVDSYAVLTAPPTARFLVT